MNQPVSEVDVGGADDGGHFGFYEGDGFVGVLGKEVFSEKALGELSVFGELMAAFEGCVEPVDSAGYGFVFIRTKK